MTFNQEGIMMGLTIAREDAAFSRSASEFGRMV